MKLSFTSDDGYGAGPAIGVIVLSTDETLEPELQQISATPGVSLYHSRIPFDINVTPETLARMEAEIPASLDLLPSHTKFNVIGYGCTSGATVIGANRVAEIINESYRDTAVTNPITAAITACRVLDVKRLGLLTPYRADVSAAMQNVFEENGIKISAFGCFEEEADHKVARISESSTLNGMLEVGAGDCDAVFASCTNLRTFGVIEQAEKTLGKPVISSNSAFAWHMYRLAGVTGPITGPGQLFRI